MCMCASRTHTAILPGLRASPARNRKLRGERPPPPHPFLGAVPNSLGLQRRFAARSRRFTTRTGPGALQLGKRPPRAPLSLQPASYSRSGSVMQPNHTRAHTDTPQTQKQKQTNKQTNKTLLPSVKRQVFCVRDRLKMVTHRAWETTIGVSKSVGSMTTKGQMKPTCSVRSTERTAKAMSPNIRSYPVFSQT